MKRLQTLALEQKEDARHGDATFPIQKYITSLKPDYPVVTTHWHEEAEFTLITEGDANYQIDLTSYAVEKDDLIFIPPLLLHSVSRGQSALYQSETYVFHMNFLGINSADVCAVRYLTPLAKQKLIPPFVIRKDHPAYGEVLSLFHAISQAYETAAPGYELMLKSLFLQLIAVLLPYCTESSSLPQLHTEHAAKLKLVLDYIEHHYAEDLTIEQLAGICYFSEYYFMRFFKKYVGMSCLSYIKNLRLEKAAEQFEQGESSTLSVSLAVGFHNLSYFHREFKKKYGMTPKKFMEDLTVD